VCVFKDNTYIVLLQRNHCGAQAAAAAAAAVVVRQKATTRKAQQTTGLPSLAMSTLQCNRCWGKIDGDACYVTSCSHVFCTLSHPSLFAT
jgi:hypothetical protein